MTPRLLLLLLLAFFLAAIPYHVHRENAVIAETAALQRRLADLHAENEALNARLADLALAMRTFQEHGLPVRLGVVLADECEKNGVDVGLALRVIKVESGFRTDAVNVNRNKTIDGGLFQLNSNTWPSLAEKLGMTNADPFNPDDNIKMGVYYLGQLTARLGVAGGLTAYNHGPRNVSRDSRSEYSERVMKAEVGK